MVLGLTAEGYVVYQAANSTANPEVVSINGNLLFFTAFNAAKQAAEAYIQTYLDSFAPPPPYVWIEPISKLWINGEN